MKKRFFAALLTLCMVFTLLPVSALATGGEDSSSRVTTNDALIAAIASASDGDTIYLGEGSFSTYGVSSSTKSLTFVGSGAGKTNWYIGAAVPTDSSAAISYQPDYSFDNRNDVTNTVTFKDMTMVSVYGANDTYRTTGVDAQAGFVGIGNLVFEDCTINGTMQYNGWKTTTFKNVIFNCRGGSWDYSIETLTGNEYTFDNCTFNTPNGKIINAFTYSNVGTVTINYKNCIVNSQKANKSVLNIKDGATNYGGVNYKINISGNNPITGLKPNTTTCSRLFQVETTYPTTGTYSVVTIDGTEVWNKDGMVDHSIDCTNDKYTDGYEDDAFTYSEWVENGTTKSRTKTCNYCGYQETETVSTKKSEPGIEKSVVDVDDDTSNTTSIAAGSVVSYKLESNVPETLGDYQEPDAVADPKVDTTSFESDKNKGTYKLAFHDVLNSNLTIDASTVAVTVNGKALALVDYAETTRTGTVAAYQAGDNGGYVATVEVGTYTLDRGCETDTKDSLYVELNLIAIYNAVDKNGSAYFTKDEFGKASVIVTYDAKASESLAAGKYENTAWVEYEGGNTEKPEVDVYSYGIKVFKYDTADENKGLSGAEFELYDGETKIASLTTDEKGFASTTTGLKAGTYTLKETKAPDGYVKSEKDLDVIISKDNADAETYFVTAKFANSNIPHTGGTGTLMFTLGGAALIAAAGAVMVTTRKKGEREK